MKIILYLQSLCRINSQRQRLQKLIFWFTFGFANNNSHELSGWIENSMWKIDFIDPKNNDVDSEQRAWFIITLNF